MNIMKRLYLLLFLGVMMIGPNAQAADARADKNNASLWYDAFSKKDPDLFDRILGTNWVDIPPAPNQPPGPAGARQILVELTTAGFAKLEAMPVDACQFFYECEGCKTLLRPRWETAACFVRLGRSVVRRSRSKADAAALSTQSKFVMAM
jgi:hypothetical protein